MYFDGLEQSPLLPYPQHTNLTILYDFQNVSLDPSDLALIKNNFHTFTIFN